MYISLKEVFPSVTTGLNKVRSHLDGEQMIKIKELSQLQKLELYYAEKRSKLLKHLNKLAPFLGFQIETINVLIGILILVSTWSIEIKTC